MLIKHKARHALSKVIDANVNNRQIERYLAKLHAIYTSITMVTFAIVYTNQYYQ